MIGLSYYALCHDRWPVKDSLDAFETCQNAPIAIVWNTFGNNFSGLSAWKDLKKRHLIEVHLLNGPGLRNKRLGKYEALYGYSKESFNTSLIRQDKKLNDRLTPYFRDAARTLGQLLPSDRELYVSPDLESNLTQPAFHSLMRLVRPHFDPLGARYVWNPDLANPENGYLQGFYYELHGSTKNHNWIDIYNLDGEDIAFKNRPAVLSPHIGEDRLHSWLQERTMSRCNFIWLAEFNGLSAGSFIDPRDRTNFPSRETFQIVRQYL